MFNNKTKILVLEPMFSENILLKKEICKYFKHVKFNYKRVNKEKVIKLINNVDGIVLGLQPFDKEVVKSTSKLRFIAKFGTGLDNVDLNECKRKNIKVINAPNLNSISVSELVLSNAINLTRSINENFSFMKNGIWKKIEGGEIFNKKVGIIGLGAAGKEVAKRFYCFGSKIYGNDLIYDDYFMKKFKIIKSSKAKILSNCDIITLHVPLTNKTKYLINKKTLELLKNNAILINTSRGGVVKISDLIKVKKKKNISIFLDVFENEPYNNNILLKEKKSIFTPHIGGTTRESKIRIGMKNIHDLINFFK